jgi:hypothetical protein
MIRTRHATFKDDNFLYDPRIRYEPNIKLKIIINEFVQFKTQTRQASTIATPIPSLNHRKLL